MFIPVMLLICRSSRDFEKFGSLTGLHDISYFLEKRLFHRPVKVWMSWSIASSYLVIYLLTLEFVEQSTPEMHKMYRFQIEA